MSRKEGFELTMSPDIELLPPPLSASEADALIRSEFATLRGTYLDVAARGPLPASAGHDATSVLRAQMAGEVAKDEWLALVDTVRGQAAQLLGVRPEEMAFTKNTSEGLNIVGSGLRLGPRDQIVVATAVEHPNNVFPWLWQAQERGAEVISVTPGPDEYLEEAIIRHIGARTRLVAVTAVDFGTGRRTDLTSIGEACRARGAFLLVDAAQSSGVLVEDMARLPVDGWSTAVQKGLLGPYGMGLLYVSHAWTDRIRPVSLARFSVELKAGHEAAGPGDGWRLRDGSGRYEVSNYNYVALAALRASLAFLQRIGPAAVEQRSIAAANHLRAAAERLDIPLLKVPQGHHSHILSIAERQEEGHDRSEVAWINDLSATLTQEGVAHSVRRGAVRLATHVHVLPEVLERAVASLEGWRRKHHR
jgi:cysteine desulfurase/selenocysteine lyase